MKIYTIVYAENVPCYAMREIEAQSDGEAIALALDHKWENEKTDPDYDSAVERRIVNIEEGCRLVACDIPLELDASATESNRLRHNARQLYDALKIARIELARIFQNDASEILRVVNAALNAAEGAP